MLDDNLEVKETNKKNERRKEQVTDIFFNTIVDHIGGTKNDAKRIFFVTFSTVLQRIDYNEAKQFISQLPEEIQSDFLDLKAGPDPSINEKTLLNNLKQAGYSEEGAYELLPKMWTALETYFKDKSEQEGELHDVLNQLPKEMEFLFGRQAKQ